MQILVICSCQVIGCKEPLLEAPMLDFCHKMMISQLLVSATSCINILQNKHSYCLLRWGVCFRSEKKTRILKHSAEVHVLE